MQVRAVPGNDVCDVARCVRGLIGTIIFMVQLILDIHRDIHIFNNNKETILSSDDEFLPQYLSVCQLTVPDNGRPFKMPVSCTRQG